MNKQLGKAFEKKANRRQAAQVRTIRQRPAIDDLDTGDTPETGRRALYATTVKAARREANTWK